MGTPENCGNPAVSSGVRPPVSGRGNPDFSRRSRQRSEVANKFDTILERAILFLTLGLLLFGPVGFGAANPATFVVLQLLAIIVTCCWAIRLWLQPKPRVLLPPICGAVAAFVVYAVVRYRMADIEYVARLEVIRVLVYAFVFFVIVGNLQGKDCTQWFVFSILALAVALSFYATYQFLAHSDRVLWSFKPYTHRGSATYISPNHLAGFLEMVLPLALSYTLVGRTKVVGRILLGYAALAILAGIAVTVSRGALIATVFSLIVLFGFLCAYRAYRLPALIFFVCIVAATAYLAPKSHFFQKRTTGIITNGRIDDDARFAIWEPASRIWRDNLWWGAGPAHFDREFRAYRPEVVQLQPEFVHNDYLNALADYGVAGAAIIFAALALLAFGVWRTWRVVRPTPLDIGDNKRSNKFAFVLGASCGLGAILVHSVVDFNMHVPANALVAVALLAWLSTHLRFATDRYWFPVGRWARSFITLVLLGGAGYLTWQASRHVSELKWLNRASTAAAFSVEEVGFLKRAFAAEPHNADTAYYIGEALRRQSQEGGKLYRDHEGLDYRHLGEEALQWFEQATKLDPWLAYGFLGQGWCLDWLERTNESPQRFDRAEKLDPNGYYMVANIGLHYVETGDYPGARCWFERSLTLQPNNIALSYLQIVNARLLDQATNVLYQSAGP